LNYLNLSEIRGICHRNAIPYRIEIEAPDGRTKPTSDTDRKPVVLGRIRHYLTTGELLPATCIPARIVRDHAPPPDLKPRDRLYYRWYNKTYTPVIRLLEELTEGRFENGALARVLIMEFWTRGEAPTFRRFAEAWLSAKDGRRDLLSPEYAFLTDLRRGGAGADWKAMRRHKAQNVLAALDELAAACRCGADPRPRNRRLRGASKLFAVDACVAQDAGERAALELA
jgi:hypothetical protein